MRYYRIRGTTEIIKASCMNEAIRKLVDNDMNFVYKNHWYTKSNRMAWAEVVTDYGYRCIVDEINVKEN